MDVLSTGKNNTVKIRRKTVSAHLGSSPSGPLSRRHRSVSLHRAFARFPSERIPGDNRSARVREKVSTAHTLAAYREGHRTTVTAGRGLRGGRARQACLPASKRQEELCNQPAVAEIQCRMTGIRARPRRCFLYRSSPLGCLLPSRPAPLQLTRQTRQGGMR